MLHVDVLLLDLVVVLVAARLLGGLARRLGQPPVVGEIVAGILLGPTLLGPWIGDDLFGPDMRPPLQALADVGLILFMFVVGLELDQKLVRGKGRTAATVALGSTTVPFVLGVVLALGLAGDHADGKTLPFVLFLGAAMSATAFPVLARILTDREMHRTTLGGLALACAAVIDVLAWTVLAVVVAIAGAEADTGQWMVLLIIPYALVMFLLVRPLLARLVPAFERAGRLTPGLLALVLIGLIGSSWATEWMHVHFIFGAFLFGAVMPRAGAERLTHHILERLEQLTVLLLLPMFFVVSGLSVNLRTLNLGSLGALAAILAVAIGGKLAGTYAAARLRKVPGRQAAALATLLNTRGLTEIVILNVGLQKGVLDSELYSLMVLMALITTAMTGPLLRRIYPDRRIARDIADAGRAALGVTAAYRVVAVISGPPEEGEPLATLAARAAPPTPVSSPPAPPGSLPAGSVPATPVPPGSAPAGSVPVESMPATPVPAGSAPAAPVPAGSAPAGSVSAGSVSAGSVSATASSSASSSEVVLAHLHPLPGGRLEVGTGLSVELAEMTETLGALEVLASRVRALGPEARVVNRFSADVAAEMPGLVAAAHPDLLVLPRDAPGFREIVGAVTCRVVTAFPSAYGKTGPVAVLHEQGGSGDAAAHVALTLALALRRPLIVAGGGRAVALAQRLERLGVEATGVSPATLPAEALVVASATAQQLAASMTARPNPGPPIADLLVTPEQDADPVDWAAALPTTESATPS